MPRFNMTGAFNGVSLLFDIEAANVDAANNFASECYLDGNGVLVQPDERCIIHSVTQVLDANVLTTGGIYHEQSEKTVNASSSAPYVDSSSAQTTPAPPPSKWDHAAVCALISVCQEFEVDKLNMKGGRCNSKWASVAKRMGEMGHPFSVVQCRVKWCQEKGQYRKYIDQSKRTGAKRIEYKYADAMAEAIGDDPLLRPKVLGTASGVDVDDEENIPTPPPVRQRVLEKASTSTSQLLSPQLKKQLVNSQARPKKVDVLSAVSNEQTRLKEMEASRMASLERMHKETMYARERKLQLLERFVVAIEKYCQNK